MDRFLSNFTSSLRNFKPFTFSNFTLQSSEILAIIANSACLEFTSLPRRTIARETEFTCAVCNKNGAGVDRM